MISGQLRKVHRWLAAHLIIDRAGLDQTLFLAGAGRSGTTWLAEVLCGSASCRHIFEPFHNEEVLQWAGQPRFLYLRPDETDPALVAKVKAILSGRVQGAWVDQCNRVVYSNRRLIKEIRANLMLGWLSEQFPQMAIALVIRHPCAVIHSRMSMHWESNLEAFREQTRLMEDMLAPFAHLFDEVKEPYEQQALRWCIEHYVPLKQLAHRNVPIFFYEDFCIDPSESFSRLFDALNVREDVEKAIADSQKPSRLCRRESAVLKGTDLVHSWQEHFTPTQLDRIDALLAEFGLNHLYASDGSPNHAAWPEAKATQTFPDEKAHHLQFAGTGINFT